MTFIETWANIESKIPTEIFTFLQTEIYRKNNLFIDIWSIIHLLCGGIIGFITKNPIIVFFALILFEIFENTLLYPYNLSQYENMINIFLDIFLAMIGWVIVRLMFFNGKISFSKF